MDECWQLHLHSNENLGSFDSLGFLSLASFVLILGLVRLANFIQPGHLVSIEERPI
jgi:hypothetical protein